MNNTLKERSLLIDVSAGKIRISEITAAQLKNIYVGDIYSYEPSDESDAQYIFNVSLALQRFGDMLREKHGGNVPEDMLIPTNESEYFLSKIKKIKSYVIATKENPTKVLSKKEVEDLKSLIYGFYDEIEEYFTKASTENQSA